MSDVRSAKGSLHSTSYFIKKQFVLFWMVMYGHNVYGRVHRSQRFAIPILNRNNYWMKPRISFVHHIHLPNIYCSCSSWGLSPNQNNKCENKVVRRFQRSNAPFVDDHILVLLCDVVTSFFGCIFFGSSVSAIVICLNEWPSCLNYCISNVWDRWVTSQRRRIMHQSRSPIFSLSDHLHLNSSGQTLLTQ